MKALNRPDLAEPWKTKTKCKGDKTLDKKGCGAELEISEEDLKSFHYYGTHFKHVYLSVKCPFCGLIIHNLKIPEYVIDRWNKKHPRAKSEFDGFDDRV